ncbi:hypothetical protein [Rahnella inusitata]|uniref:hypothetical protein n=1 Tax=Rahnella inusitata TaxID=58169 RepID=UPI0039AF4C84
MTPSKIQIENLHDNAEAVFVVAKMLLNNYRADPNADEDGTYEGVIKGVCNLSHQLSMDLFAIKEAMQDE